MKIINTGDKNFNDSLSDFLEIPKIIPASSLLVKNNEKSILLVCVYHDSGLLFIHGLFKSKLCTNKDFLRAVKLVGDYINGATNGKYSIVTFTTHRVYKKVFEGFNFKKQEISLLSREQIL